MGAKWHLIGVFICICLKTSEAEHISLCLLATCAPSLEKWRLKPFDDFWIRWFLFLKLLLSCGRSLRILNINHVKDAVFADNFSHSVRCLSTLLIAASHAPKFLIFVKSNYLIFSRKPTVLLSRLRRHHQIQCYEALLICSCLPLLWMFENFNTNSLSFKAKYKKEF